DPSEHMPWYKGPTLMHVLENVHIGGDRNLRDFRLPVQWVNRPNLNFRGFAGQVASGTIRPGEAIQVMPSGKTTTVKEVLGPDGPLEEAFTPMSVTLTFNDEIDASRGDTIVHAESSPTTTNEFEAMLVWMHEEELSPGREYLIKHGPHRTYGTVDRIINRVDVNTLDEHDASRLELNEIARVAVRTSAPMVLDDYENNRGTGAFVIIDRLTNVTVGAGMIRLTGQTASAHWETEPGAILAHQGSSVSAEERRATFGHGAATVLFTGLTGSGKTTIALELERRLFERNVHAAVLDGQAMRMGLNRDLGFSAAERSENLRRSMELARLMNGVGTICLAAFVAPEDRSRQAAQELIGSDRFILVHLDPPLEVCRDRDGSGLYEKQESGEHASIPGVTQPYEAPETPDLRIDTSLMSSSDAAELVVNLLKERQFIQD
ncbi:MAG: adenylyl-sulfate kinase, partial [Planctomycetota bacterium]|nr:adenylyl-sulfate kinase [Planctomycetota bacterium]